MTNLWKMASSITFVTVCFTLSTTHGAALGNLLDTHNDTSPPGDKTQTFDSMFDFGDSSEIDDYMRVEPEFVDPRELRNPFVNHHKFSYNLAPSHEICAGDVYLLALVKTKPENFVERQDVRDTWGSVTSYKGTTVVPVFIMGTRKAEDQTAKVKEELLKESVKYGDIVQGDFVEHFKNQTYKTVMGLVWAGEHCSAAKFALMTTDSTMVDTYHLVTFLKDKTASDGAENLLYCSAFVDNGPVRDPNDKLFIPINTYPYKLFPPHCEGFAYVISGDVMKKLLDATKSVPFLWLDDVYVTGLLPLKARVSHVDMAEDHAYTWMQKERLEKDVDTSMFLVAPYKELRKNWEQAWKAILKKTK